MQAISFIQLIIRHQKATLCASVHLKKREKIFSSYSFKLLLIAGILTEEVKKAIVTQKWKQQIFFQLQTFKELLVRIS